CKRTGGKVAEWGQGRSGARLFGGAGFAAAASLRLFRPHRAGDPKYDNGRHPANPQPQPVEPAGRLYLYLKARSFAVALLTANVYRDLPSARGELVVDLSRIEYLVHVIRPRHDADHIGRGVGRNHSH